MNGSFANTALPTAMTSAIYDAANELTNWNGTAIGYDLNGNMLSDGSNVFIWNARNQVATLNSVSLQYDGFGRRTKNLQNTSFLFDGANAVQELSGSTPTANLINGDIDEIFSRADSTGAFTPLQDALGSAIALVDSSGGLVTRYAYDSFGNTAVSGSASSNAFQYTGRQNEGNGLYFYRARYYYPFLGRFVSEDPIRFAGGINHYSYTGDDPINFVDPSGMDKNKVDMNTYSEAFKFIHHCAADQANTLSIASLTGTQDTLVGSLILGNDASSLSTIIAGPAVPDPPGTAPITSKTGWSILGMAASNPVGKDIVGLGINAVGMIPNVSAPTTFILGENGAGTAFAKAAFKPGIGTSGLGKMGLGLLGDAFIVKAIYDGVVYTGAMFSCYQSPDPSKR